MRRRDDWRVEQILNLDAFLLDDVMRLMARWTTDTQKWAALARMMTEGRAAVFAGGTDQGLQGLFVVLAPDEEFLDHPQVAFFTCSGGPSLRNAMLDTMAGFLREYGWSRFTAINSTGQPDRVWQRTFRRAGVARKVSSVLEFEVQNGRCDENPVRGVREQLDKHPNRRHARRAKTVKAAVRKRADKHAKPARAARVPGAVRRAHGSRGANWSKRPKQRRV